MIKEFTVELSADEGSAIRDVMSASPALHPDMCPGKKTFAFNDTALIAMSNGNFECFLWSSFDRVEEHGDLITLARGDKLVFVLPVAKLEDPGTRRAIFDYVSGRVALNG